MRLVLNLLLNLEDLGLQHHLVVSPSSAACAALSLRAERVGVSVGCGQSSFLQRGTTSAQVDAGLDAYDISDSHVYHLWWQRWFLLSEAHALDYGALFLDTDVSLRADPYPFLRGALEHHSLFFGWDDDQSRAPFHFPAASVSFVYVRRGPPGTAAHWVLSEMCWRLEQLLRGVALPLPARRGQTQQVLWDSSILKDVLETAAFTPSAPSHRHVRLHCAERDGGPLAGHRAAPLPPGWLLSTERLRFFDRPSVPSLPSAWMPLHVPAAWRRDQKRRPPPLQQLPVAPDPMACNHSSYGSSSSSSSSVERVADVVASGSVGVLPMWFVSRFQVCPHGGACGRWGSQPPSTLIGSLVGVKARFWIMRVLGWWNHEASRPTKGPSDEHEHDAGGATTITAATVTGTTARTTAAAAAAHVASTSSPHAHPPKPPLIFPKSSVRPLVLRGHTLRLRGRYHAADVHYVRVRLARWTLLAIALGRRAVLPMIPCELTADGWPELPAHMQDSSVLTKLLGTSGCDARSRTPSWRLAASVAPLASPQQLRATAEMRAIGNYSSVLDPRPIGAGCCVLLPERRCVDQLGERGELGDEIVLSERDLGWLGSEEEAVEEDEASAAGGGVEAGGSDGGGGELNASTVRPDEAAKQPLSLDALRAHAHVRTLIVELPATSAPRALRSRWLEDVDRVRRRGGQLEDSFALLPSRAEVRREVRARLQRRSDRGSTRSCIERLLKIAGY